MSVLERFTDALERNEKIDKLTAPATRFWGALLRSTKVREVLSGKQLGHPAHPALVLIPSGTLLSATALDLIGGQSEASKKLTVLGLASSIPAVTAGWSDWLDLHEAESRVGFVHAVTNAVGLGLYGLSLVQKKRGTTGRAASVAGATVLGLGGWLGGHLAYAQGVGVDTTAFQAGPTDWTDLGVASDLGEELRQVTVEGVALLVTSVAGKLAVIADRCTHRGASLSEGKRIGNCVACPWHDSRFDLATGAVEQGPAVRPQPSYETRVVDGRVQARRIEPRALRRNAV